MSVCRTTLFITSSLAVAVLLLLSLAAGTVSASDSCTFPSQRIQCGDFTCNASTGDCIPCTTTDQCWNSALECQIDSEDESDGKRCLLKNVGQLAESNLGGFIGACLVGIITCAVAVVAGTGGGGILSACYQILLGIPLVDAVAMSQATIVGQASFNMVLQMRRHHPNYQPPRPTRPAINYPLIALWMPICLVGTMLGNLIGKTVPDWFRMTVLIIFFTYALKRLVSRMLTQRKKDQEEAEAKKSQQQQQQQVSSSVQQRGGSGLGSPQVSVVRGVLPPEDEDSSNKPLLRDRGPGSPTMSQASMATAGYGSNAADVSRRSSSDLDAGADKNNKQQQDGDDVLEPAFPQYPWKHFAFIVLAVFAPLLVSNVAKNRWVTCKNNEAGFWGLTGGASVWSMLMFLGCRAVLSKLQEKIVAGEEDPEQVPFNWNEKTTIYFPFLSVFAGLLAAMTGIGGGMILGLLFYESELIPEEASPTGGFATFCVAVEALIQFIVQKKIQWDYFLVFFGCGIIATAIGQLVLMPYIKKRGWKFLIVGALMSVMAGTMLAAISVGTYDTVRTLEHDGTVGFGSYCPSKGIQINHLGGG